MAPKDDIIELIFWALSKILSIIRDILLIIVLSAIIYYGFQFVSAIQDLNNKLH